MKIQIRIIISIFLIVAGSTSADTALPLSLKYWKDEHFLKSFNGSYRINARIEPTVETEERLKLLDMYDLMVKGKRLSALKELQSSGLIEQSAAIAFNAGNICFELGETDEAEKYFKKALGNFPNFRRAHRNLGFVFAKKNDWGNALSSLGEAVRLGDQDGGTYGMLAYGHLSNKHYSSALQAYKMALLTEPNNPHWKIGAAKCLHEIGSNKEATSILNEINLKEPPEASYWLLLSSLQITLGEEDEAITNLELLQRIGKLSANHHLILAQLHLKTSNFSLAKPTMLKALKQKKKPSLSEALKVLSLTTQKENWILAREFSAAIHNTFDPIPAGATLQNYNRLKAIVDINSPDTKDTGLSALEQIIKENPLDIDALITLARFHAKSGNFEKSELLYEQAAAANESYNYSLYLELTKLYVAWERYSDALKPLDMAIKLQPSSELSLYREAVAQLTESSK